MQIPSGRLGEADEVANLVRFLAGDEASYCFGDVLTAHGRLLDLTMPTLFSRIIEGEIPGTFVWRDDLCVGFMSINPLDTGHALVVPRVETDHWLDLDLAVAQHLMVVSQFVGRGAASGVQPDARRADDRRPRGAPRPPPRRPDPSDGRRQLRERREVGRSRRPRERRRGDPHRAPRPRSRRGEAEPTLSASHRPQSGRQCTLDRVRLSLGSVDRGRVGRRSGEGPCC